MSLSTFSCHEAMQVFRHPIAPKGKIPRPEQADQSDLLLPSVSKSAE